MTIDSTEPAGFDRFAVEFLTQPNGAAFTVAVDGGAPIRVSTAAAVAAIRRFDLPLDRPARRVELRADRAAAGRAARLDRRAPGAGVIYENHGTIGATVGLLDQMTPRGGVVRAGRAAAGAADRRVRHQRGVRRRSRPRTATRRASQGNVEALRRAAHGAPVLVLGPPDGNRVDARLHAPRRAASGDDCAWREPAKLAAVRDIQRRVAAQQGWAYWDWFGAMGGTCSIDRMSRGRPAARRCPTMCI